MTPTPLHNNGRVKPFLPNNSKHLSYSLAEIKKPELNYNEANEVSQTPMQNKPSKPKAIGHPSGLFSKRSPFFKPPTLATPTLAPSNLTPSTPLTPVNKYLPPQYIEYKSPPNAHGECVHIERAIIERTKECLISTTILPEKSRSIFKFSHFNKIQSQSYNDIYMLNNNSVISAPTGSGKTVLFELAILKVIKDQSKDSKILYLAPTKALCMEKYNDWSSRFGILGLSIGVLTGDTSYTEADRVKNSSLIISTPEKWDLLSRRWMDYEKLFDLVKLLLVDEIHILRDPRGATLEVVITRMKRICRKLRIIALSATIANIEDISSWLKLSENVGLPAKTLKFDDSYRAVKLDKVVFGYKQETENNFLFDSILNSKLNEVILQHSNGKPVLIFCPTRNSAINTAKYLAQHMTTSYAPLNFDFKLKERELSKLVQSGIAFHHAGLVYSDRQILEKSFLSGKIKVLCSTSTLAVGINLPAYLVIIKGTKCWLNGGFVEYSETDILQMIGRAGRPQFEKEGKAVILTSLNEKNKYQNLVNGTEKVESCLHLSFAEHLAAEVGMGTIKSLEDGVQWLQTTFFYIRFMLQPSYYSFIPQLKDGTFNLIERLNQFLHMNLQNLLKEEIIRTNLNGVYEATEYGNSMSKHYISLETMKLFIHSSQKLSVREIITIFSKSSEFGSIRLKYNEKRLFKEVNLSPLIKYSIKSKDFQNHDKILLLIQYELGGLEFPGYTGAMKLHSTFLSDKFQVFKLALRIVRSIIDVFSHKKDSESLNSCLVFNRCLNGKCWEGSPMELRQFEGIGLAYVRKLVNHNINSIADAKILTSQQLEYYLGVKAGAGKNMLKSIKSLPRVSHKLDLSSSAVSTDHSKIQLNIDILINVENSKIAYIWQRQYVMLSIVTELSNGELLDFRRIPISKFSQTDSKLFQIQASIDDSGKSVNCHIATENIAGLYSCKSIDLNEKIEPWKYRCLSKQPLKESYTKATDTQGVKTLAADLASDSDMSDLDMDDVLISMAKVESKRKEEIQGKGFNNLSSKFQNSGECQPVKVYEKKVNSGECQPVKAYEKNVDEPFQALSRRIPTERMIMENGNFQCNHPCKDRSTCRHICCKEGIPNKFVKANTSHKRTNSFEKPLEKHLDTKLQALFVADSEENMPEVKSAAAPITIQDLKKRKHKTLKKPKANKFVDSISVFDDNVFDDMSKKKKDHLVAEKLQQIEEFKPTSPVIDSGNKNSRLLSSKRKKIKFTSLYNILDLKTCGIFHEFSDDDGGKENWILKETPQPLRSDFNPFNLERNHIPRKKSNVFRIDNEASATPTSDFKEESKTTNVESILLERKSESANTKTDIESRLNNTYTETSRRSSTSMSSNDSDNDGLKGFFGSDVIFG